MTETTVVHIRDEFDVYIGRPMWRHADPRIRAGSVFQNDFKIGKDGNRAEVIAKYRAQLIERLASSPYWRAELEKLRGKRLGCWCAPNACHGDVLAEILNEEQTK